MMPAKTSTATTMVGKSRKVRSRSRRVGSLIARPGASLTAHDHVGVEHDRAARDELGELFANVVERIRFAVVKRLLARGIGELDQAEVAAAEPRRAAQNGSRLDAELLEGTRGRRHAGRRAVEHDGAATRHDALDERLVVGGSVKQ